MRIHIPSRCFFLLINKRIQRMQTTFRFFFFLFFFRSNSNSSLTSDKEQTVSKEKEDYIYIYIYICSMGVDFFCFLEVKSKLIMYPQQYPASASPPSYSDLKSSQSQVHQSDIRSRAAGLAWCLVGA